MFVSLLVWKLLLCVKRIVYPVDQNRFLISFCPVNLSTGVNQDIPAAERLKVQRPNGVSRFLPKVKTGSGPRGEILLVRQRYFLTPLSCTTAIVVIWQVSRITDGPYSLNGKASQRGRMPTSISAWGSPNFKL